ncbi:DUF3137 domain-containing protein [Mycoplasmopsis verecunda]|uniref:DUF3137 domain-containing protein n=1 Tax=Mycoplasmopsis verecunda TaxID=171291 RepID=A0A1T4LC05_9BACT|nr:DUF3137 domain-containing protein [Mycoplasmopsis verecunda]WPB54815.1 DUF3137 domain-containing protein [Mycoplasmopsis verecunda]SJZ52269.1 Protein of unknown function [Mycoplasmopsis verecunda]
MKRVADYLNFSDFKNEADEKLLPIIKDVVQKQFSTNEYSLYQKNKKIAIIVALCTILPLIITLATLIPGLMNSNGSATLSGIVFLGITVILIIVASVYNGLRLKAAHNISKSILFNINKADLHLKAINILQPKWKFLGSEYECDNPRYSYDKSTRKFQRNEYYTYRPSVVPSDAYIADISNCQTIVIDDKYPAHFSNAHWIYETQTADGRGNRTTQETHFYVTLLKIDARYLESRHRTSFMYFGSKWYNPAGMKSIKLENNDFNRLFKLQSNDEMKMRMLFTPLAMENMSNMWNRNYSSTNIRNISVSAQNDIIYMSFLSPAGFGLIDVPKFAKDPIRTTNFIYSDILKDIFSLYFLLQLVYIPNYLY